MYWDIQCLTSSPDTRAGASIHERQQPLHTAKGSQDLPKDIRNLVDFKIIIAFIENDDECSLPAGNTVLKSGNRIGILTEKENIKKLLELCGTKVDALKKIALVGAGRIGTIVADHIIEKSRSSFLNRLFGSSRKIAQDFVIIDSDKELCNQVEKALDELVADGTYKKIAEKYPEIIDNLLFLQ